MHAYENGLQKCKVHTICGYGVNRNHTGMVRISQHRRKI